MKDLIIQIYVRFKVLLWSGTLRNKILGVLGVAWGAMILFNWYSTLDALAHSEAYNNGRNTAAVIGIAMLAAGLWTLTRKKK